MELQSNLQESASAIFFCRMCKSVYRQAKLLPCLHSFCRPCLVNAVTHGKEGSAIECPICSHKANLPPTGIVGLKDNCFLNRICHEYINKVKQNLEAKGQSPESPSEFDSLRLHLNEEILSSNLKSPNLGQYSSSSSHQGRQRFSSGSSQETFDSSLVDAELTQVGAVSDTTTVLEAIRNTNRLQAKKMNLQGQALKVTYSIDELNESLRDWKRHKDDLKLAIERRSAQFQFYIKRMERQLINQIDSKVADDQLFDELDKRKGELRQNLKNILHEVSQLKWIQEFATNEEVNDLSSILLSSSVAMFPVNLSKPQFQMNTPPKSMEEVVAASFGTLQLGFEVTSVFKPEVVDFKTVFVETPDEVKEMMYARSASADSQQESDSAKVQRLSRITGRSATRYTELASQEDAELRKGATQELTKVEDFQNARETLKQRRKEILNQGFSARTESPFRDYSITHRPRSVSREGGRVQSLDRATMYRANMMLPELRRVMQRNMQEVGGDGASNPEPFDRLYPDVGASHQTHHPYMETINLPSPVVEEAASPSSPQAIARGGPDIMQMSSPAVLTTVVTSPEDASGLGGFLTRPHRITSTISSGSSSRQHSRDTSPSPSPGEYVSMDLRGRQRDQTSRPLRRAVSNVDDKRSKMELLRENWQRRKELLQQSESFDSSDKSQNNAGLKSMETSQNLNADAGADESTMEGMKSPTHHGEKKGHMQSIKNKFSSIKQSVSKRSHRNGVAPSPESKQQQKVDVMSTPGPTFQPNVEQKSSMLTSGIPSSAISTSYPRQQASYTSGQMTSQQSNVTMSPRYGTSYQSATAQQQSYTSGQMTSQQVSVTTSPRRSTSYQSASAQQKPAEMAPVQTSAISLPTTSYSTQSSVPQATSQTPQSQPSAYLAGYRSTSRAQSSSGYSTSHGASRSSSAESAVRQTTESTSQPTTSFSSSYSSAYSSPSRILSSSGQSSSYQASRSSSMSSTKSSTTSDFDVMALVSNMYKTQPTSREKEAPGSTDLTKTSAQTSQRSDTLTSTTYHQPRQSASLLARQSVTSTAQSGTTGGEKESTGVRDSGSLSTWQSRQSSALSGRQPVTSSSSASATTTVQSQASSSQSATGGEKISTGVRDSGSLSTWQSRQSSALSARQSVSSSSSASATTTVQSQATSSQSAMSRYDPYMSSVRRGISKFDTQTTQSINTRDSSLTRNTAGSASTMSSRQSYPSSSSSVMSQSFHGVTGTSSARSSSLSSTMTQSTYSVGARDSSLTRSTLGGTSAMSYTSSGQSSSFSSSPSSSTMTQSAYSAGTRDSSLTRQTVGSTSSPSSSSSSSTMTQSTYSVRARDSSLTRSTLGSASATSSTPSGQPSSLSSYSSSTMTRSAQSAGIRDSSLTRYTAGSISSTTSSSQQSSASSSSATATMTQSSYGTPGMSSRETSQSTLMTRSYPGPSASTSSSSSLSSSPTPQQQQGTAASTGTDLIAQIRENARRKREQHRKY